MEEAEIPADVPTLRVGGGFDLFARRVVIKRDPAMLLWALGEVERDLQVSLGPMWTLAMRPSLGVIAQHDGQGKWSMASIEPWLETAQLELGCLDPHRREDTYQLDALDAVAHAAHWVLYDMEVLWPACPEHSTAHVDGHRRRWVCPTGSHDLGAIGSLPPAITGTMLAPTPVMSADEKRHTLGGNDDDDGLIYTRIDANSEAIHEVVAFVRSSAEVENSGAELLHTVSDPAHRGVTLLFRHPDRVPPVVHDQAASRDVRVTLGSWPYSPDELSAAAQRVIDACGGDLGSAQLDDGFEIFLVSTFDAKFAGLRVSGGYPDDNQRLPDETARARLEEIAGMPVRFHRAGRVMR